MSFCGLFQPADLGARRGADRGFAGCSRCHFGMKQREGGRDVA